MIAALAAGRLAVTTVLFLAPMPDDADSAPSSDAASDATTITAPLRSYDFTAIRLTEGLLGERQRVNRDVTLPAVWERSTATGRIANFRRAAGRDESPHEGLLYNDSDVYKLIEGASAILAQSGDAGLDARLDALIDDIVAAQKPDGYINTYYTLVKPEGRWEDLAHGHELYCLGHLMEAGATHYTATGKRTLFRAADRAAALVDRTFGPEGNPGVPGHPELALALLRLHDLTGNDAQLALAEYFIEQRGQHDRRPSMGEYCQDHAPIRDQDEVLGHAVRAMYLYTAATDIAVRRRTDGDPDLALESALKRLWDDLVSTKMYITGGIGSSSSNEGFTTAYDLPNDEAYAETCAAIGLVLWAHQMNLLTGEARFADVLERALYNAVLAGVSLSGDRFHYSNPMASRGQGERVPWFDCACCPPNILRLVATLGRFVFARTDDVLYVNLYTPTTTQFTHRRTASTLEFQTAYPDDGAVRVMMTAHYPGRFTLALRIPEWCRSHEIRINGAPVEAPVVNGYARLDREWTEDAIVDLLLEMPVEEVRAPEQVRSCAGRFALTRGPIVYCVEGHDSADDLRRLYVPPGQTFRVETMPNLLGGVETIAGTAQRPGPEGASTPVPFRAIPYATWANRGPSPMLIWLPESAEFAEPAPDPTVTPSASHCWREDTVDALLDGRGRDELGDDPSPRFTWWPRRGTTEWVQYDLVAPRRVSGCTVDWFDDADRGGGCRAPAAWRVLGRFPGTGTWTELAAGQGPDEAEAATTRVRFDAVELDAVRLEVTLRDEHSAGVLEWRLHSPDDD